MKKIIFSLVALATLVSCAKTEALYDENSSEIKIIPVTSLATKAVIEGNKYPRTEHFDVHAYWADDWTGTVTAYFACQGEESGGVEFEHKGDGSWGGVDNSYYWPKDGSLKFACYSPSSVNLAHKYDGDVYYSKKPYKQSNSTDSTIDLLLAPTTAAKTSVDDVAVDFKHALAWITIKVKAANTTAASAYTITGVTINDVKTQAELAASMSADLAVSMKDGAQVGSWMNPTNAKPYVVFADDEYGLTTTATEIETVENGTIVIPQTPTTVTIDYIQNAISGTAKLENQQITLSLDLQNADNMWQPGRQYTYTLTFGLDEILITPSIVNWKYGNELELDL